MTIKTALLTGTDDRHISWLSDNIGLHQQVEKPWQALVKQAKLAGFDLAIASGFRSFDRQLAIWNRKMLGELAIKTLDNQVLARDALTEEQAIKAILVFSALPGSSRHHWGTDLDFYSPSLLNDGHTLQLEPWEYQPNGPFSELTQWLNDNATKFDFYFPYDQYRGGVAHEPWHLSYAPLANKFLDALNVERLAEVLAQHHIEGKQYLLAHLAQIHQQYITNVGAFNG